MPVWRVTHAAVAIAARGAGRQRPRHAAECAGVEAFNQVKDHENTGCLALRMLAKRWVQGVPTDGKAHWCHVQSAQDHSARVASLPSKLSANMKADGHLLFS